MATRKSTRRSPPKRTPKSDNSGTSTRAMRGRPQGVKLKDDERLTAQEAFLVSFAEEANFSLAAKAAGVARKTVYEWQEHDEAFSLRFKDAEAQARDVIRAALHDRSVRGWDEPMTSMGKIVTVKGEDGVERPWVLHKYDSSLLGRMATARLPEYKQQVDVTSGGERLSGIADALTALLGNSAAASDLLDAIADRAHRGTGS